MKTVLITGDLVIDHYLIREPRLPSSYAESCGTTFSHRGEGGAWFLAEMVKTACRSLGNVTVSSPPLPAPPHAAQAHTVWAQFPRTPGNPKEKVWRIAEFLGCEPATSGLRSVEESTVAEGPSDPDLLVIEDVQLGFADDENRWPAAIREGGQPGRIVLKLNFPPVATPLWNRLLSNYADRMTVVVNINTLRARGAAVSCGLSWDQTIEELAREFESGPSAYDLARCRRTVVYFPDGSAAGSFTRGSLRLGPAKLEETGADPDAPLRPLATFERFLYLPDEVEGGWLSGIQGRMFGMATIVTAAVARHELDAPSYPLYLALGRALSAGRWAFEVGGQRQETKISLDEAGIRERLLFSAPNDSSPLGNTQRSDPAFAYCTAYPHEILDDERMHQPATKSDLLRDVAGPTVEYMKAKAFEIVMNGPKKALRGVPKARYGGYSTVDRQEIERINAVRALIDEYCGNRSDLRPLSIAVFGQPGSGKSFAIKQLGKSLFGDKNPVLEFNLSQFADDSLEHLYEAFHRVRDASIRGTIPLVFWDEFDTDNLAWLRHFLVPMQDAEFRSGSDTHVFGKSIFVFAGGTKHSFAEFDCSRAQGRQEREEFRNCKGPDFISRLRGYIDIKGPNAAGNDPEKDPSYVIRRAVILRATLEQMYGHLIDTRTERANVDAAVVHAFLNAEEFLHGARSLQSLLAMCRLQGARRFGVAQLNTPNLLSMHVSADFFAHFEQYAFDTELIDAMAEAIHSGWVEARQRHGWSFGDRRDDVAKTDPSLRPYQELSDSEKDLNRAVARVMPAKLHEIGYRLARHAPLNDVAAQAIPDADRQRLARQEHDRWLRERLIEGFEYAPVTNKSLRQHRDVVGWDQLGCDEQELDLVISEVLPEVLARRQIFVAMKGH
ncbi:MAG: hypothetical protein GXY83_12130 [Rhodopirellula sp.]|nr:hypothetical protein [Rhodopirellula sp.]